MELEIWQNQPATLSVVHEKTMKYVYQGITEHLRETHFTCFLLVEAFFQMVFLLDYKIIMQVVLLASVLTKQGKGISFNLNDNCIVLISRQYVNMDRMRVEVLIHKWVEYHVGYPCCFP